MDNTPIIHGSVSPIGVFVPRNKELLRKHLQNLKGTQVEMVIRKARSQRSAQQNRYYQGVVVKMIAEQLGEDREKVHRMLKGMFLKRTDIIAYKGKILEVPSTLSTTDLGKDEFFDAYVDKCRAWAAEFLELVIPDPNQINLN